VNLAHLINQTILVQTLVSEALSAALIPLLAETSLLQLEHVTTVVNTAHMDLIALLLPTSPHQETVELDNKAEVNAEPPLLLFLHTNATGTYTALVALAKLLSLLLHLATALLTAKLVLLVLAETVLNPSAKIAQSLDKTVHLDMDVPASLPTLVTKDHAMPLPSTKISQARLPIY